MIKTALTILWITSYLTKHIGAVVRISTDPANGRVKEGSYWEMRCEIKGTTNIVWHKWVGDMKVKIGYNDMVFGRQDDTISAGRFMLSSSLNQDVLVSELSMSNSQFEDSGRYECSGNNENASAIFVVCEDTNDEYCSCMLKSGWANPMCYPQEYTDLSQHYKNVLAGLGITLAVSTVYVVLITVFYGRDCISLYQQDRRERSVKKKNKKMLRSRVKRDTLNAFKLGDSDETQLTPSETNSEVSAETAGNSEDSGFSGSTKDKRKDRNKATSSVPTDVDNQPLESINYAYNPQFDLPSSPPAYNPFHFTPPSVQRPVESVSKNVEFSGTMI